MQTGATNKLGTPSSARETNATPAGTHFHVHGGSYTSIGRDMNNNYRSTHTHSHLHSNAFDGKLSNHNTGTVDLEPRVNVLALLKTVSNYRKIQQDMFSKATPKTGEWILNYKELSEWQTPKSSLTMMCGSGIRECPSA